MSVTSTTTSASQATTHHDHVIPQEDDDYSSIDGDDEYEDEYQAEAEAESATAGAIAASRDAKARKQAGKAETTKMPTEGKSKMGFQITTTVIPGSPQTFLKVSHTILPPSPLDIVVTISSLDKFLNTKLIGRVLNSNVI